MTAVDIGIGHNDNFFITQFVVVPILGRAGTNNINQII